MNHKILNKLDKINLSRDSNEILDIVLLTNCILTGTCSSQFPETDGCPSITDLNGDGGYNVLDIVTIANCILEGTCGQLQVCGEIEGTAGRGKYAPPEGMSEEVHRGILEKILNAGEDINQIKFILDGEVSNIQTTNTSGYRFIEKIIKKS